MRKKKKKGKSAGAGRKSYKHISSKEGDQKDKETHLSWQGELKKRRRDAEPKWLSKVFRWDVRKIQRSDCGVVHERRDKGGKGLGGRWSKTGGTDITARGRGIRGGGGWLGKKQR